MVLTKNKSSFGLPTPNEETPLNDYVISINHPCCPLKYSSFIYKQRQYRSINTCIFDNPKIQDGVVKILFFFLTVVKFEIMVRLVSSDSFL